MTAGKIALVGGGDDFGAMLLSLLRDSGYEVETFAIDDVDLRDCSHFGTFDLVVAADVLADGVDEAAFIKFVVSARRFLFYETGRASAAATGFPASYLVRSMGPEDLVTTIGDAVWEGDSLSGKKGRSTPRARVDIEVTYVCGGEIRSSRIVSISANGLFIRTADPPARGTPISLSFTIPGGGGRIEAAGRAIYAIECDIERGIISRPGEGARRIIALPGVGVVFEEIAETARDAVRQFVEKHRGSG